MMRGVRGVGKSEHQRVRVRVSVTMLRFLREFRK